MENITEDLSKIKFTVFSEEEIKALSVKEITETQIFDSLNLPVIGGLYDPALGCTRKNENCTSCSQSSRFCPGHMGHINLVIPVFNPAVFKQMITVLKASCLACHRLYEDEAKSPLIDEMQQIMNFDSHEQVTNGTNTEMKRLSLEMLTRLSSKPPKVCLHCQFPTPRIQHEHSSLITAVFDGCLKNKTAHSESNTMEFENMNANGEDASTILIEDTDIKSMLKRNGKCVIVPSLARQILLSVMKQDGEVLGMVYQFLKDKTPEYAVDMFFQHSILVPPSRFRPLSVVGDKKFEHPQTAYLQRIMVVNKEIQQFIEKTDFKSMNNTQERYLWTKWQELQKHVNHAFDSDLDKMTPDSQKLRGIRQLFDKKGGLFRMNMMGKRVNFCARSVISPDPFINTNEVGIPEEFAKRLTVAEYVNPHNVHVLRQNVINGPDVHPGALAVVNSDGTTTRLSKSASEREAIAKQLLTPQTSDELFPKPKQVLRHLKDGDSMLLNRQPTLHRPSIQAHKARIQKGMNTMRIHYSNCKAYNADFDGDEMNAHLPQGPLSAAEAVCIASSDCQYLVPKDGTPVAGLIQDHVVAALKMTIQGNFFTRGDYMQILQVGLYDVRTALKLLPPCIMKPEALWSGKQVLSTILLNLIPKDEPRLSFKSKAKVSEKSWISQPVKHPWNHDISLEELDEMGESTVLMVKGELLQGVLDKSQVGSSPLGLVHNVQELYGGAVAGRLLTCLGRVFSKFLKFDSFTFSAGDVLLQKKAELERKQKVEESKSRGYEAALEAFGLTEEGASADEVLNLIQKAQGKGDAAIKNIEIAAKRAGVSVQNDIAGKMNQQLLNNFPANKLQLMVQSGAKGSSVNCMQISNLVGQVELEGRRPAPMISGRSLPCFQPFDCSLRSRGFVTDRFLTGVSQDGYFFHSMAGREGLVDTAVKTSRSGYLQRCLVKHMEGLNVRHDMTVRDTDNSVIQFLYGEDGLDVTKATFLQEKNLPFIVNNMQNEEGWKTSKAVRKYQKKVNKWKQTYTGMHSAASAFQTFCQDRCMETDETVVEIVKGTGRTASSKGLEEDWRALDTEEKQKIIKKCTPCPDPVSSQFFPQQHPGVLSEKLVKSVNNFKDQLKKKKRKNSAEIEKLPEVVNKKFMTALCTPEESVGMLCAQSLGEQTTQMTLNTFHFAGRGEMNVTMGIPRLRELLMTASANLQTPSMDIPVLDTPEAEAAAQDLLLKMNRVYLSDVLQEVSFFDVIRNVSTSSVDQIREYRIRFKILPRKSYDNILKMKPKKIIEAIKHRFIAQLAAAIQKTRDTLVKNEKSVSYTPLILEGGAGDEDDSDEEADADITEACDSAAVEQYAEDEKLNQRQSDMQDYAGDEDEDVEMEDCSKEEDIEMEGIENGEHSEIQQDSDDPGEENIPIDKIKVGPLKKFTINKKERWCEVVLEFVSIQSGFNLKTLVDKQVKKFTLQHVPGINRCMLVERTHDDRFKRQKRLYLVVDGINMKEIMKYNDILDLKYLYTNSISDFEKTYGIEAARTALIKEVVKVFEAFCIQVDYRHLSLLADYMTREGVYKGFNRHALNTNPSVFQKTTFEMATSCMIEACINAWPDKLKSPSSRVVAGLPVLTGTSGCEIVHNLHM